MKRPGSPGWVAADVSSFPETEHGQSWATAAQSALHSQSKPARSVSRKDGILSYATAQHRVAMGAPMVGAEGDAESDGETTGQRVIDDDEDVDLIADEEKEQDEKYGLQNLLQRLDIMMMDNKSLFFDTMEETCKIVSFICSTEGSLEVGAGEEHKNPAVILPPRTTILDSNSAVLKVIQSVSLFSNISLQDIFKNKIPDEAYYASQDSTVRDLQKLSNSLYYQVNGEGELKIQKTLERMSEYLQPSVVAAFQSAFNLVEQMTPAQTNKIFTHAIFGADVTDKIGFFPELFGKIADKMLELCTFEGNLVLRKVLSKESGEYRKSHVYHTRRNAYEPSKVDKPAMKQKLMKLLTKSVYDKSPKKDLTVQDLLILGGLNARTYYDLYMWFTPPRTDDEDANYNNYAAYESSQFKYEKVLDDNWELKEKGDFLDADTNKPLATYRVEPPSLQYFLSRVNGVVLKMLDEYKTESANTEKTYGAIKADKYSVKYGITGLYPTQDRFTYDTRTIFQTFCYLRTDKDFIRKNTVRYLTMPPPPSSAPWRADTGRMNTMERRGKKPVVIGPKKNRGVRKEDPEDDVEPPDARGSEKELPSLVVYIELCRERGSKLYTEIIRLIKQKEIDNIHGVKSTNEDTDGYQTRRIHNNIRMLFAKLVSNFIQLARIEHPRVRQDRQREQIRSLRIERYELQTQLAQALNLNSPFVIPTNMLPVGNLMYD